MKRTMFIAIVALVLIVCVSVSTTCQSQYKTQALTGSFNVTEPPLTPTPTPTPSPTVTPTRTPNSDGGSSDKPEPGLELTINMVGKTTEWMQNTEGMILENIAASSRDGRIACYISIGTIILGPNAKPLSHIFTGVVDPFTKSPPSDLPDRCYFVDIYEFLPEGARFSKPVNIQLSYEESDIPGGIDEATLKVFTFNATSGTWTFIASMPNTDANTVIFSTDHFSIYTLVASAISIPPTTPTPTVSPTTPSSQTTSGNRWIWIIIILIAECLILDILLLVHWRKQKRSSRKYN